LSDILTVQNKPHLTNYLSKLVLEVKGPGLCEIAYASNRLVRGSKPQAHLVLVKDDGSTVQAKRTRCEWRPWRIDAEFEFEGGPKIVQRSWVDWPFVHSGMRIEGSAGGAKLAAEGESYRGAKAMLSPYGTVLVEEMDPSMKPFALEIASSVKPYCVLTSTDGSTWSNSGLAWSEEPVRYRMVFDHLPRALTVSAHLGKTSELLPVREWGRSRRRERIVEREWVRAYERDFPDVTCPDARIRDLVQFCFYVHRSGVIEPGGMLPYPYVVPSKLGYPAWWMWDTAFHAVHDAWMRDPSIAFGDLLNHTILQSKKGCIQDAAGEYYADTGGGRWVHPEQYDNFPPPCTGPPVTGIALWDVYQKTGSLDLLKRMYPNLVLYERWIIDAKASGLDPDLIAYKNWFDCGWDDSKRWGKGGMKDVPDAKVDWDFPVVPVDGNVFLSILRQTLSKTAALAGDDALSREYAEKAERTRRAIDRLMWSDEKRFYFDVLPDGKMLDVWTPAGFVPLLAGMPCPDRYHMMRAHLLNSAKFWSKYPLPTLSLDDPDFSTQRWWRGGTWPVINWQVNEGVFNYDTDTGLQLLMRTIDMMTHEGSPTCREYYDPVGGKGGGAIDQGWGTMPVDLILRRMLGLNPMPDRLELKPHLPADWPEASVRNVFVAGTSVDVRYARSRGALTAQVTNTGEKPIVVSAGEARLTLSPREAGSLDVRLQSP